jgi:hypothetical protein
MIKKLSLVLFTGIWMGAMVLQSMAGFLELSPRTESAKLHGVGVESADIEREHLTVVSLAALVARLETEGTENAQISAEIGQAVDALNELYGGKFTHEVVIAASGANQVRLSIASKEKPGEFTSVLYVLNEAKIEKVLIGDEAIASFSVPGAAGSAYGEHDEASMAYVRDLVGKAAPEAKLSLDKVLSEVQLAAVRTSLEGLPATVSLKVEQLPAEARTLATISDLNALLAEAMVVDDPDNKFLVAFIEVDGRSIPVFERNFLASIANDPEQIAQLLVHEDLEPRIARLLAQNAISEKDVHAHDVVTAVQNEMVGPSVVGRPNRLFDEALRYRKQLGVLQGQDLKDAGIVEAFNGLDAQAREHIHKVAAQVSQEAVGIALDVDLEKQTAVLGGVALEGAVAEAVLALGLSNRSFVQGVDLAYADIAKFLTRAVLLNQKAASKDIQMENAILNHQIQRGAEAPDAPKAVIMDVDTVASIDNKLFNADGSLNEEAGVLEIQQAAIGLGKALSQKMLEINGADGSKGNVRFFLTSKKLPQNVLDIVLQQLDAVVAKDSPVAISYKDGSELMQKVSEKFGGKALTPNDVLFYVSKDNIAEHRAEAAFAPYFKVIEVPKAEAGQRVSVAKLMVGLQWLYMPEQEARNVDAVAALFKGILTELYQAGEISEDEYKELLPLQDADTGFLIIPPVKADSPTKLIEDTLRTSMAAAKFA